MRKSKKPKVKPSRHYQEGQDRPGHDISLDEVKAVIESPDETETQDDGRLKSWRRFEGQSHPIKAVTSATASAGMRFIAS